MKVLGLHKDPWHNTGACVMVGDGASPDFAFLSEERIDRVKDSRAFPTGSTRACMNEMGVVSEGEFDFVVMDYIERSDDWRFDQAKRPCSTENFLRRIDPSKIHMIDHHLCHAYSTFMTSPFEEAAILIVDGRGSRKQTQSLFWGRGNSIEKIEMTDTIGIGLLYAAMTQHIGFGLLEEGKTMGLAPFALGADTSGYMFNGRFNGIETDYSIICNEGDYTFKIDMPRAETEQEKALGAYAVQKECERAMLHLAAYAKEKTGAKHLCLSGGVALNSVANHAIYSSRIFDDVFINPAASDTGIPLGAAFYGYHALGGRPRIAHEVTPYTGPTYSKDRISSAIASFEGYDVFEQDAMKRAIDLLVDNKIVGRFEGRSEMGPRALGHRSLLMSPLLAENKDVMNARVKFREAFRPFAPIVMDEYASKYFLTDRPCRYMLMVPPVHPEMINVIPAVTHVDGTARVQTVTKAFNGRLYDILEAFRARTGVPVLMNTSYNVAGEPIVETPEDAIKCFLRTNIDALFINEIILIKPEVLREMR
jgi:carbamoyltransferase